MTSASQPVDGLVCSVGYEGRTVGEFVDVVAANGVGVVVDVRLNAISRKPGFSKTALTAALADAAIGYRHERDLGNPKDNRDGFRRGLPVARERYRQHLENGATSAYETVARLVCERRVALLCFERDHATCHRSCVTERMRERWPHLAVVCL